VPPFNNIKLNTAGTYTLTAADKTLTTATSSSFTVVAAAAARLAFGTIPATGSDHTVGTNVTVEVRDKFNNVVLTDASTVTLSYASAPAHTTPLSITSQAVSGVATFSGLTFPSAGHFSLRATDSPLTVTTSKPFTLI